MFKQAIVAIADTWDVLVHGHIRAWDEERGCYYQSQKTALTRADLIDTILAGAIGIAWVCAMAAAFIDVIR